MTNPPTTKPNRLSAPVVALAVAVVLAAGYVWGSFEKAGFAATGFGVFLATISLLLIGLLILEGSGRRVTRNVQIVLSGAAACGVALAVFGNLL